MKLPQNKYLFALLALIVIYFGLRLQHLQSIPIFGDEAIYLRWSQLIKNVETLRFVPQSDGKQPLFMWITAASYKIIHDPLFAGRFISLLSGAGTVIVLFSIASFFFNPSIGLITSAVYVILPFTFFFDRMALPDNLLSFFGTLSLLFALLLAKFPRLDLSLILGFILGLAWLTKSPAIYFLVLSVITFLIINNFSFKKIYLPLISSALGYLIYNILRLGPQFQQIALRNKDYIWSLSEIIKHPLDPLVPHLKDIAIIYSNYISLPIIIISIVGLIIARKVVIKNNYLFVTLLWWFLPLIANAGIAKVFTARYILFTVPPLIILISVGIYYFILKTKNFAYLILLISLIPNGLWLYNLSTHPFGVKLSSTESGYVSGWTSGWGIKQASSYLIERSKVANVIVGTEGYFGTLPDGLQIYTDSLKQLTIFGVGINLSKVPEKLLDAHRHGDEVYLLINSSRLQLTPDQEYLVEKVMSFSKPDNDSLVLYKVVAKP